MSNVLEKEVRTIRLFGKDIVVEVQTKPPEEVDQFLSTRKTIEKKQSVSKFFAGKKVRLFALSSTSEAPNYLPILSGSQPSQPPSQPAAVQNHCRRRKRKIRVRSPPGAQPASIPPQLSSRVLAAFKTLGGTGLVYLADKTIEVSDVNETQNRLFIPNDGVNPLLKALTAEEKDVLQIRGDKVGKAKKNNNDDDDHDDDDEDEGIRHTNKIEGKIEVTVIDGEGNYIHGMNFKMWPSVGKLVLLHGWYQFVEAYGLKAGDSVQLWCFRGADSRLCFAVVKNIEIKAGDAYARVVDNGTASSSGTSALSNA